MHLSRSSSNVPRLPSFLEMLQNCHVLFTFDKVHNPLRLPRETTSEPPKVVWTCGVFYVLISKCASCHNGMHFFDMSTSKSAPRPSVLNTFDLEMCFTPQRRALFHISTSQSGPMLVCFARFDFETCFAPQQRLFISHLARWLRTRRFSEPTFRPCRATNHWKNTMFRDFPTFSRTWIFFLLRLSLFWSSFFFSSLLWLFPSLLFICPYCRKFDF